MEGRTSIRSDSGQVSGKSESGLTIIRPKAKEDKKIVKLNGGEYKRREFGDLSERKALILISLDNDDCKQESFKATVEAALAEFNFVTILIADEIYRHNLIEETYYTHTTTTEETRQTQMRKWRQEAIRRGDQWLEMHSPYLNEIIAKASYRSSSKGEAESANCPLTIVRWRDWLQDTNASAEYQALIQNFTDLYKTIDALKQGLQQSATEFATRRSRNDSDKYDLYFKNAMAYLLEECPAIIWIAAKLNYNAIIYPGKMTEALNRTRKFILNSISAKEAIMNSASSSDADVIRCKIFSDNRGQLIRWVNAEIKSSYASPKQGEMKSGTQHVPPSPILSAISLQESKRKQAKKEASATSPTSMEEVDVYSPALASSSSSASLFPAASPANTNYNLSSPTSPNSVGRLASFVAIACKAIASSIETTDDEEKVAKKGELMWQVMARAHAESSVPNKPPVATNSNGIFNAKSPTYPPGDLKVPFFDASVAARNHAKSASAPVSLTGSPKPTERQSPTTSVDIHPYRGR